MEKQIKTEERKGKPWELVSMSCTRCGGSGYVPYYVDGGVCFKCGGNGRELKWRRILTDKEKASRERAKVRRVEKKAEEQRQRLIELELINKEFMENSTYIVNLNNTYDIKEELKELGGRFTSELGWHFNTKVDKFPTIEIKNNDLYDSKDNLKYGASGIVQDHKDEFNGVEGQKVGTIGEKVSVSLTLERSFPFDGAYGGGTCYVFKDDSNNTLVWYTNTKKEIPTETFDAFATIKRHSTYNGVQQTYIKNVRF